MKVVAVKKDSNGTIQQYKLDDGRVIGQEEAINMAKSNELDDYNVGTTRNGSHYIRNNADGDESNNLDSLSEF